MNRLYAVGLCCLIFLAGYLIWLGFKSPSDSERGRKAYGAISEANYQHSHPQEGSSSFGGNHNSNITSIIQSKRAEYLALHKRSVQPQPLEDPVVDFWVEILESNNHSLSAEAFKLFSLISEDPINFADQHKLGEDGTVIKGGALANETLAADDWQMISSRKTISRIVKVVLEKYLRDSPEASIKILNTFTMNVYDSKDHKWWIESYQNSKLAAILAGEPMPKWINKLE